MKIPNSPHPNSFPSRANSTPQVFYISQDARSSLHLAIGSIVQIKVQEVLGNGVYKLEANGVSFFARSTYQFSVGIQQRYIVQQGSGAFILFALPIQNTSSTFRGNREDLSDFLTSIGLPDDTLSRLAFSALTKAGQAPEARILQRLRKTISTFGQEYADIAARIEAKGMGEDSDKIIEIMALQEETTGYDTLTFDNNEAKDTECNPNKPWVVELTKDKLPASLAFLLRTFVHKNSNENTLLQQYNRKKSAEAHWIACPYRFGLDNWFFSGILHIKLPLAPGGAGQLESKIQCRNGDYSAFWALWVRFVGAIPIQVQVEAPCRYSKERLENSPELALLSESLRVFGCQVQILKQNSPLKTYETRLDIDA